MLWISMSVIDTNHGQHIIDEIMNFYGYLIFVLHLKWHLVCHWLLSLGGNQDSPFWRSPMFSVLLTSMWQSWFGCLMSLSLFLLRIVSYSWCYLRVLLINPYFCIMKQSSEGTFFMGLQSICSLYYSYVDLDINFWPGWTGWTWWCNYL